MNEPRNLRTSDVTYSDTLSAPRIGRSTWTSRVSWSAILVGLFVAMAVQFMILSVSLWGKFGLGAVGSITDLNSNSWVVGIWTALAASVGILVGGYVAAWLAGSRTSINGMWHGIAVWGLAVLSSVILSSLGIAGIMGFGLAPSHIINYFGLTGAAATGALGTASLIASHMAGWFLLASFVSLIVGAASGMFGLSGRGTGVGTVTREEEHEERRVA